MSNLLLVLVDDCIVSVDIADRLLLDGVEGDVNTVPSMSILGVVSVIQQILYYYQDHHYLCLHS